MTQREAGDMECSIVGCPGNYKRRLILHALRHDRRVIVIDRVPAEACSACGDVLFEPGTIRGIESLLALDCKPASAVPLYNFPGDARRPREGAWQE